MVEQFTTVTNFLLPLPPLSKTKEAALCVDVSTFFLFPIFRYVTCTLHCDVPAIAHICGFDTANLVIDLTRRSFASMEKMALDSNVVSKWPTVCSDIKTYRLPTPVLPPKEEAVVLAQNQVLSSETANMSSPTTAAIKKETQSRSAASAVILLFTLALL